MAEAPQIGEEIATQIGTLITSLSAGVGAMTEGGSADAKNAAAALAREVGPRAVLRAAHRGRRPGEMTLGAQE